MEKRMENQGQEPNPVMGTTTTDRGSNEKGQPTREQRNVSSFEPQTEEELNANLGSSEASAENPKPSAD